MIGADVRDLFLGVHLVADELEARRQLGNVEAAGRAAREVQAELLELVLGHLAAHAQALEDAHRLGDRLFAALHDLVQRFGRMVRQHGADDLTPWLAEALESDLRSFAEGLRQDLAAVWAALATPWSNGQTEGQITRLKLIKRSMYGRAKLDLLRIRVMAA